MIFNFKCRSHLCNGAIIGRIIVPKSCIMCWWADLLEIPETSSNTLSSS